MFCQETSAWMRPKRTTNCLRFGLVQEVGKGEKQREVVVALGICCGLFLVAVYVSRCEGTFIDTTKVLLFDCKYVWMKS